MVPLKQEMVLSESQVEFNAEQRKARIKLPFYVVLGKIMFSVFRSKSQRQVTLQYFLFRLWQLLITITYPLQTVATYLAISLSSTNGTYVDFSFGQPVAKVCFVEAACTAMRALPYCRAYFQKIKHRKGSSVSIVALARKLSEITHRYPNEKRLL